MHTTSSELTVVVFLGGSLGASTNHVTFPFLEGLRHVARDAVDSVAQGGTVCFVAFFDDVVAVAVFGSDGVGGVGGLPPMVQSAAPVAHVLGLVLVWL